MPDPSDDMSPMRSLTEAQMTGMPEQAASAATPLQQLLVGAVRWWPVARQITTAPVAPL